MLQVALGAILLLSGREAEAGLHYLYGVLPVLGSRCSPRRRGRAPPSASSWASTSSRCPTSASGGIALAIVRRETGIMAVSALVIFGLALRAATTGGERPRATA